MTRIKPKGLEVVIYKSEDGSTQMEVNITQDSVWLSLDDIAYLFERNKSSISRHLRNIFNTHELSRNAVVAKNATTASDGKTYMVDYFNLDAVISIGYRVNSSKATQFRIWATKVLKDHLIQGYSLNRSILLKQKEKLRGLQSAINFIEDKAHQSLLRDQSVELLSLIRQYTKSLDLLEQYDKKAVKKHKGNKPIIKLTTTETKKIVVEIRNKLSETRKDIGFFGIESSDRLSGIVENLNQTYDGKELYKTIEEKAANLLYLIIKDHPFIDGNKRTGSLLFVHYLDRNNILYTETGERKINDSALVAIALLVAISDPKEKSVLVNVIVGLIS